MSKVVRLQVGKRFHHNVQIENSSKSESCLRPKNRMCFRVKLFGGEEDIKLRVAEVRRGREPILEADVVRAVDQDGGMSLVALVRRHEDLAVNHNADFAASRSASVSGVG